MTDRRELPRLEIADLSVRFEQEVALDAVSLRVAAGESVAIVGPSGCGKSTLLRAIAGLQDLDEGRIVVDGTDITSVPTHRRGIGLMFQDHALFAHRDVAGNIEFGLAMQDVDPESRSARISELLDLVDLSGFGNRMIPTLSGGESQRVALARSLAPAPSILLLDEPLGALDQHRRERLVLDLRRVLRAVNQTVLYVTHDLAEASAVGDRIAIMHDGRIIRVDTAAGLWNDPRYEFVARFIGLNVVTVEGELAAVAPDEIIVQDASAAPEAAATVIGAWFADGSWMIAARSRSGHDLRWISHQPPEIGSVVAIGPAPGTPLRPLVIATP